MTKLQEQSLSTKNPDLPMTSAGDLVRDLDLVNEILEDLDLSEDEILNEQLAEISIELDGVLVDHDAVAERTRLLLSEIHCQNITAKLEAVVQSALGYYSLADQPEGTNEPPIGPQSAIQLLNKLRNRSSSLMQIKDELHGLLAETKCKSGE